MKPHKYSFSKVKNLYNIFLQNRNERAGKTVYKLHIHTVTGPFSFRSIAIKAISHSDKAHIACQ